MKDTFFNWSQSVSPLLFCVSLETTLCTKGLCCLLRCFDGSWNFFEAESVAGAAKKRVDLFSVSVRVALAHYLSKSRRSQPNTDNKHFFLILYFMPYPTLSPFLGLIQFWRILFRKVLLASIKQWISNYDRNKIKEKDEEIKKERHRKR